MSAIDSLLQLKQRLDAVKSILQCVDENLSSDIVPLAKRTDTARAAVTTACQKAASLNPFVRLSEREIQRLTAETTALEELGQVVEESNKEFVAKRVHKEVARLKENVESFLVSYSHFIDVYGFALTCSDAHLLLAQSVDGEHVILPNKERDKHLFILGATGSGKSEAMLGFVLQDLFAGRNGILLDPFGGLSHKISSFVMAYDSLKKDFVALKNQSLDFMDKLFDGVHAQSEAALLDSLAFEKLSIFEDVFTEDIADVFPDLNVKLVDLSSKVKDNPYRINPFRPSKSLSTQDSIQLLLDAISIEMGGSLRETPQAAAIMEGLFAMIAANGGGFGDILPTLNMLRLYKGKGQGQNLLPAELFRQLEISHEPMLNNAADYLAKQLLSFSGNNFNEQVNSTRNRLNVLNNSKLCHALFLTSETTFDLGQVINSSDERKPFVIMHIPSAETGGGIAATYIFKLVEKILRERGEQQKKELFYLYADEFYKFLGESAFSATKIGDLFTAMRQYGLAMTVAMQNSAQLKAQDSSGSVFSSVVESCKTKIVFNCSGEDAKYFAENIFKDKGKMQEISYTFSNGEAQAFTINASIGFNQGWNASNSMSDTVGESQAKAIGHSVSEGYNQSTNASHTVSASSTEGQSTGSSSGTGISYKEGMEYHDITQKSSSMISCSQQFSKTSGTSDSTGKSEGTSLNTTNSETCTTTNSKSHTDGRSYGISEGSSETMGLARQLSRNSSCAKSIRPVPIAEEVRIYAQQLTCLEQREAFVACDNNLKKVITLDSIFIKLENVLEPYLNRYYEYLYEYQNVDRWVFKGKVEMKDIPATAEEPQMNSGVDGVF